MELRDFAEKVCNVVREDLGERYQVHLQEVQKNNGVYLLGMMIQQQEQNVSPTIYLNAFWEAYEMGTPFGELAEYILQVYHNDTPKKTVDMNFFKDYEQVKDRICYKLIHAARNEELLKDIPYVEFLDLAICFYYAYEGEELGSGSILIHNSHLELWDSSTSQLMKLAQENTKRLFPWECSSMESVIRELLKQQEETGEPMLEQEEQEQFFQELPMQILSNNRHTFGAACLLYPGLLEELSRTLAAGEGRELVDLYVLPSSIHEVILMPVEEDTSREQLALMIREVNATQVEPEEVLSDSLYLYNAMTQKMEMI